MEGELQLTLLGKVDISRDGEPIAGFSTNKDRALLIYLAATGRPHARPTLAGLLWGDMPEANARTNLRRSLSTLRRLVGAHLDIDRQTVAFDRHAPFWIDVEAFEAHALSGDDVGRLQEAVELYQGDFLEGFFLRGAPAFEEWAVAQGARLRELALQALHTLSVHYVGLGQAGLKEGIDYTTRLLVLEPWREEAHRGLMQLLAGSGQRGAALAQYEACRQLLARELGVEPGPETKELYERIRDGDVRGDGAPISAPRRAQPRRRGPTPVLPAFLRRVQDVPVLADQPAFVAREQELARLGGFLEGALAGQGTVAFVTGGPGRGKTTLITEFARRAMDEHPDLLVGMGNCNAYSGIGDPYLPFREAMGMLTGDIEARWTTGVITREHARRLWLALPLSVQALLEHGPVLVDVLVPGNALLSRAEGAVLDDAPWLVRLRDKVDRQPERSENFEQSFVFQQITNVLRALAVSRPLMLLFDDLQWVDATSAGALFHLGRRLAGARILIVGAYRSEELALDVPGTRHPLEKALGEFKRQYGDVWLDLSLADVDASRAFVDALLDRRPNRLGEGFRGALARHTAGHPLFTVELLRAMQERGDLAKDAGGAWVQREPLDWNSLPARVEAVIQERIARLDNDLRDILNVASIEGEEFTVQVVARVLGISERDLFRALSQELEGRHRLVQQGVSFFVGRQRLSRCRFTHVLFQHYVYHDLSNGERALLHGEIGLALEELYGERTEEIAAQLAHHFGCAGSVDGERRYARIAGERAEAQYANEEALRFFTRALELTPETDAARADRSTILLARVRVNGFLGELESVNRDLVTLSKLAEELADKQEAAWIKAEIAFSRAMGAEGTADVAAAIAFAQEAIGWARKAQHGRVEVLGLRQWGLMLYRQGRYAEARAKIEQALARAKHGRYRAEECHCLRGLGLICREVNDLGRAQAHLQQALAISREVGDPRFEGYALWHLGKAHALKRDIAATEECYRQALAVFRDIGERLREASVLCGLGWIRLSESNCAGGQPYLDSAVRIFRELGSSVWSSEALAGLAYVALDRGDPIQAQNYVDEILPYLETGTLDTTDEPVKVYLVCYRVLRANHDPRADQVLDAAYRLLQERAALIDDAELRRSYLQDVASHREIVREFNGQRD